MNGLYELSMKTPMGEIKGNFYIEAVQSDVNGYIEVNGKKSFFYNGKLTSSNSFMISGTLKAMFKTINYTIEGEVLNNSIVLHTKTSMGSFELYGKRI